MITISICEKTRTLELTKKDYATAMKYGTDAYKDLQKARLDYPEFKVTVKSRRTGDSYKGLDYDYMKAYIEKHDDAEKSIMAEFIMLRGKNEDGFEMESYAYGQIKQWFLEKYPVIREFNKKREAIMETVRKASEARKAAANN